jgi:hypothetical protein
VSKRIGSISLLAFAFCLGGSIASAQNANADVFFGVGTALNSSNNSLVDYFGTGTALLAPKLGGSFAKIGGDFMITKHFGVGAETDFRFAKLNYQGFQIRPLFYDFNGIYTPTFGRFSRIVPELEGGIGGVKMTFSYSQSQCDSLGGCSTSTVPYESSSHFQVHVAGGIRFYATKHVFIRPQVDFRYVPNFFQFGRNTVPEYGAAVGYSFGEH